MPPGKKDWVPVSISLEEKPIGLEGGALINYCEAHCMTERALFHRDHVLEMYQLAGEKPPLDGDLPEWIACHENSMLPLVRAAREREAKKQWERGSMTAAVVAMTQNPETPSAPLSAPPPAPLSAPPPAPEPLVNPRAGYRDNAYVPSEEKRRIPIGPEEIDLDGYVDKKGVEYLGKARRQENGSYRCLANVGGSLCIVEASIVPDTLSTEFSDEDLRECVECSRKPGSPELCPRCLRVRKLAGPLWRGPRRT